MSVFQGIVQFKGFAIAVDTNWRGKRDYTAKYNSSFWTLSYFFDCYTVYLPSSIPSRLGKKTKLGSHLKSAFEKRKFTCLFIRELEKSKPKGVKCRIGRLLESKSCYTLTHAMLSYSPRNGQRTYFVDFSVVGFKWSRCNDNFLPWFPVHCLLQIDDAASRVSGFDKSGPVHWSI